MKKTNFITLLLFGVFTLAGFFACSSGAMDDFDEMNPQIGVWYAENESISNEKIDLKTTITFRLDKSGAFYSEQRYYITYKTEEAKEHYNYKLDCNLNEPTEILDNEDTPFWLSPKTVEGYYTWDNDTKKANITVEKMSYSGSSNGTLTFTFTPDYNSARISGSFGGFSNVLFVRQ